MEAAVVCLLCGSSAVSAVGATRPRLQLQLPFSSSFLRCYPLLHYYRNLSVVRSLPASTSGGGSSSTGEARKQKQYKYKKRRRKKEEEVCVAEDTGECIPTVEEAAIRVEAVYHQNGDPLGKKELGKCVVRWIAQGMRSMAADFASAERNGEFADIRARLGMGPAANGNLNGVAAVAVEDLAFVIQAQAYLNAVPMPQGLEAICFKACTHYPTLYDHFQRELRTVLLDLQENGGISDWKSTKSWKFLKEFAKSGTVNAAQHRAAVRTVVQVPKPTHNVLGIEMDRIKTIQAKIEDFVKLMSEMLDMERDAELEYTQEELSAVPKPDQEKSDSKKPLEYLVSHGQAQQEQCDTICNLKAVSSSTGLGGLHLVLFRVEDKHKLPPTNLSPGDTVCVRTCNRHDAGATSSSLRGLVYNFGKDGCSITIALESQHGDPTFSKLFGKTVRIDRIQGLADAVTYERNCEALMLLQKNGLHKRNPSITVVATFFGEKEDVTLLEENNLIEWGESNKLPEFDDKRRFDESQLKALSLGLNKKRPFLIIQGPPGTGKTGLLKQLVVLAVQQGERVLITAPTNAAVDNMVERLSDTDLNIVRLGNPARIAPEVASKSLSQIVNQRLDKFKKEFERKRSDLRKDLRLCLTDDTLASGIRQLLKQLGRSFKRKEKETIREVLSGAQVVLSTNTGAADPLIRRLGSFDLVIIDGAGQAIEPSCWIPMLQGKRTILTGDQCQLAPVILSRKAMVGGLGVSLLERASSLHNGMLTTKLTVQYRMHDVIASWASKEMYSGLLQSHPSVSSRLLRDFPFVKDVGNTMPVTVIGYKNALRKLIPWL